MTDQAIFNADPNANKDLVVELVGEGKTYKTVDELAKGKINADIHIKRLEEEAKALREQLAGAKSVEDVLEAVKANSVSRQTPSDNGNVASPAGSSLSAADVAKIVAEQITGQETQRN